MAWYGRVKFQTVHLGEGRCKTPVSTTVSQRFEGRKVWAEEIGDKIETRCRPIVFLLVDEEQWCIVEDPVRGFEDC